MLILASPRVEFIKKKSEDNLRISSFTNYFAIFISFKFRKKNLRVGEIEKFILALNFILPRGVGFELL